MSQALRKDKMEGKTAGCVMEAKKNPLNIFTYLLVKLNFYSKFVETQGFFCEKILKASLSRLEVGIKAS